MAETVETKTPGAASEILIHNTIKLGIERNAYFYKNIIFLSISLFYLDAASMNFWSALVFLVEFLISFS